MNETNQNFPWQLERGTARIFEPQQQAEILSWFGREDIPRQQKEDFLQALIHFEDGCGGFYSYRASFLAAEALSRFPESEAGDEIVDRVLRWSYAYFQPYPHWKKSPIPLVLAAQNVLERTDRRRVIDAFEKCVRAVEDRWMLCQIALRLGQFDPGNPTAIAALVGLIEVEKKYEIVLAAARGLVDIAPKHPITLPTLIALAKQRPISYLVLRGVTPALIQQGIGGEEAIDLLLESMQFQDLGASDCDSLLKFITFWWRLEASDGWQQFAVGNRQAIDIFLDWLDRLFNLPEFPDSVLTDCLDVLEKIAIADKKTISRLTQLLEQPELDRDKLYFAKTLVAIDPENEGAIEILVTGLQPPPDDESMSEFDRYYSFRASYDSRSLAAEALVRVEAYRDAAISTLQELVSSFLYGARDHTALWVLGSLDPTQELVIETVLGTLNKPLDVLTVGSDCAFGLTLKQIGVWVAESNNSLRQKAIATLTAFIEATTAYQASLERKARIEAATTATALTTLKNFDPPQEIEITIVLKLLEKTTRNLGYKSRLEFELVLKTINEWMAESDNTLLHQEANVAFTALVELIKALQALERLQKRIEAAALALGRIVPNHPLVISIILPTFEAKNEVYSQEENEDNVENKYQRFRLYYQDLAKIGALDRVSIAQVLETFQLDEPDEEKQTYLKYIANTFEQHIEQIPESSLAQWVRALKPYLSETSYRHPYSSYDACYKIIWNCAQAMSYLAFYTAWN